MLLEKLKKEWFLLGMVCVVVLASISPELGRSDGLGQVTKVGIILVFFLHGLNLAPEAIRSGLSNWRLHLYIQAAIFVLFPLFWVLLGKVFLAYLPLPLALGFCYLFTLPSTISTCVVMTGISGGNIPGAILNASLSNILGVFLTPLLVQFFIGAEVDGSLSLFDSIGSMATLLLLPMILGQILRPRLHNFVQRHKKVLGNLDKCIILLIVYNAFSEGTWPDFGLLALSALLCLAILLFVAQLLRWGARCCRFSAADELTALFCGATKTLAVGVPMAKVIFAQDLSMILLPIMLYHPIQIFYCAFQAARKNGLAYEQTKESVIKHKLL